MLTFLNFDIFFRQSSIRSQNSSPRRSMSSADRPASPPEQDDTTSGKAPSTKRGPLRKVSGLFPDSKPMLLWEYPDYCGDSREYAPNTGTIYLLIPIHVAVLSLVLVFHVIRILVNIFLLPSLLATTAHDSPGR